MEYLTFFYRGQIERGTATERNPRPGYRWTNGYSENSDQGRPLYPWQTYRECQEQARSEGKRARFVRTTAGEWAVHR